MGEISILRPRRSLVSIPVVEAVYCESCASVSNSSGGSCALCGNISIWPLAELAGDAQFFAVAERFKIASVTELPSLATLKQLVEDLESLANQQVA